MSITRMSILDALVVRREKMQGLRRPDFKGERRRLSLRLKAELLLELEIIKLAGGEDKNAFCERLLQSAAKARVNELRSKHGDQAWQFILDRAAARLG